MIVKLFVDKTFSIKWRYYAWLILAIRLLIPFNLSMLPPIINLPSDSNIVLDQMGKIDIQNNISKHVESSADTYTPIISICDVLVIIWLLGLSVLILYQAIRFLAFTKQVQRWSEPVYDEKIINIYNNILSDLGINRNIKILFYNRINSPMVFGFIKPCILLPHGNYSDTDLSIVLKHELIHYKRNDLWYKLVLMLSSAIHWYNPFVHMMVRAANIDIERTCDYEVIKNMDIVYRNAYCQILLNTIQNSKLQNCALSTNFSTGKKTMKERISNIMVMNKKRKGFILFGVFAIIILISCIANQIVFAKDEKNETGTYYESIDEYKETLISYMFDCFDLDLNSYTQLDRGNEDYDNLLVLSSKDNPSRYGQTTRYIFLHNNGNDAIAMKEDIITGMYYLNLYVRDDASKYKFKSIDAKEVQGEIIYYNDYFEKNPNPKGEEVGIVD